MTTDALTQTSRAFERPNFLSIVNLPRKRAAFSWSAFIRLLANFLLCTHELGIIGISELQDHCARGEPIVVSNSDVDEMDWIGSSFKNRGNRFAFG